MVPNDNSGSRTGSILLTGSSGFVGRYLSGAIAESFPQAEKAAVVRTATDDVIDGWSKHVVDLSNQDAVHNLVRGLKPTLTLHLAAQSSAALSGSSARETWVTNFNLTYTLAN